MARVSKKVAEFWALYNEAHARGIAAGKAATPEGMLVTERANPLNDASPVVKAWAVPEGPCGFAWVNVRPGTSAFARFLVKSGLAHAAYHGGVDIWIREHGQSIARKEAHAHAMAEVLRNAGITAYSGSRLD